MASRQGTLTNLKNDERQAFGEYQLLFHTEVAFTICRGSKASFRHFFLTPNSHLFAISH